MTDIGVAIFTYNEEKQIKEAIESAKLLSHSIAVIDMESTDKTVVIAKKEGATVYDLPHSVYVEPSREFGIQKTPGDWILILDADERITPELAAEIKSAISHKPFAISYFRIPRKNLFGRKVWLKHGGWWPDTQIRLINKKAFKHWSKHIHSTPEIEGLEGVLKNPLLHYFHGDVALMVEKTTVFEDIESDLLAKAGKPAGTPTFFRKFIAELYRRLVRDRGFMDGRIGIMESVYQAYSKTITYLYLYEKTCLPAGRIALYNPYLDVMGGGERHILSVLQTLEKSGYEITIFWDSDVTRELKDKLDIVFQKKITYLPNIFKSGNNPFSVWRSLQKFDLFFYVTDGSYFFSGAKKTFIFCMYPKKELYNMSSLNRLKTTGNHFFANSYFTQKNLENWGVEAEVLYPYITDDFLNKPQSVNREPVVLNVGRFFSHLHTKKQGLLIDAFIEFKKKYPSDLKLVLAGGMKSEDAEYVSSLKKKIDTNKDIKLFTNISYSELMNHYDMAAYYWHFAGYGVDETKEPYAVEHLGITPLEAMSRDVIVFAYNAGGPKELIKSGETGFLFSDTAELFAQMKTIMNDTALKGSVQKNAQIFVKDNFSKTVFDKRVRAIVL